MRGHKQPVQAVELKQRVGKSNLQRANWAKRRREVAKFANFDAHVR